MQFGQSWDSSCVKMITMTKKATINILTLLLISMALGCQEAKTIGCPESADRAVLNAMYGDFSDTPNYLTVWLSHNYDSSYWNPEFDRRQSNIDRTRKWADTLHDRCTRNAYIGWLNYYQHELNSAREELKTQSQKKEMDEYEKSRKLEDAEALDYQHNHKVPAPPRD